MQYACPFYFVSLMAGCTVPMALAALQAFMQDVSFVIVK
jgi:hypothetical protein